MTAPVPAGHHESVDALHGFLWGCTTGALFAFGMGVAPTLAAAVAGGVVLLPASLHRRRVLIALAMGAVTVAVVIPQLSSLDEYSGDAAFKALLIVGALSGIVAELRQPGVLMPGFRAFRLLFLESCVLTGILGGILVLPQRQLTGSADYAGRLTFIAALVLLVVMAPSGIASALIRRARSGYRAWGTTSKETLSP